MDPLEDSMRPDHSVEDPTAEKFVKFATLITCILLLIIIAGALGWMAEYVWAHVL